MPVDTAEMDLIFPLFLQWRLSVITKAIRR
jgi:hypothetical protein